MEKAKREKTKQQKRKRIIIVVCLILFDCVMLKQKEMIRTEEIETIKMDEQLEKENEKPTREMKLEQFCDCLKTLIRESRMDALEPYIISRFISWEEGGEMAGWCPAFEHFSEYGEYQFDGMKANGVILTAADLNGDGIEDIIEYLPARKDCSNKASLVIYLGDKEKNYQISYYCPNFDTLEGYMSSVLTANYKDGIFLTILQLESPFHSLFFPYEKVTAYQIQDGKLTGKVEIQYEVSSVEAELLYCKQGMEEKAELFSQNAKEYYMELKREELSRGEAEERLEENAEELNLLRKYGEEQSEEYRKKYEKDRELYYPALGKNTYDIYCSDLDNDGEEEIYAKKRRRIGMYTGSENHYFYRTGEFPKEGKIGLNYILMKDGNGTDFEKLCGLDIWSKDEIPQMFWIESWNGENILLIEYCDENYFKERIEGYRIKEGSYEMVLSVQYGPKFRFDTSYERKTKEEWEQVPTYLVYFKEKEGIPLPRIYNLPDQELENKINQNLEEILLEHIEAYRKENDYEEITNIIYDSVHAAKDYLLFNYEINNLNEQKEGVCIDLFVDINLKNGEIRLYKNFNEARELWEAGW